MIARDVSLTDGIDELLAFSMIGVYGAAAAQRILGRV